jgi:hypothetical protein
MTKLEAIKEVARRDGATPAEIEIGIRRVMLANAFPFGPHEEIPAGEEEAFILMNLERKRTVDFMAQNFPSFNAAMETKMRSRARRN